MPIIAELGVETEGANSGQVRGSRGRPTRIVRLGPTLGQRL